MSAREGAAMPSGPVRFAVAAGLVVLAGVVAAVLELSPLAIVIVMGLAWVAAWLAERAARSIALRGRPGLKRVFQPADKEARHEPPPTERDPDPEPRRRMRFSEAPAAADLSTGSMREWNVWELERRARQYAGADAVPEEWAATFMYLREFAKSDGRLPPNFDSLVRESFPELTRAV